MASKLRNFVLFGAAGSGKGSIASKMVADFGFKHISSGDLLRRHIYDETDLGKAAKTFMDEGKLVPDNIIINLITNEVSNRSSRSIPILLDGFPRTLEQAKALNESFPVDVTLRLDVLHDTIIDRMSQRWVHAPSGRTYSYDYKPPRHVGLDDVTGEPLSQREEDTPEFIKRRLEDYETMIFPLISYYESNPTCMVQSFQGTDPDKMYYSIFDFLANELIVPCFPAKKSRVKKGK